MSWRSRVSRITATMRVVREAFARAVLGFNPGTSDFPALGAIAGPCGGHTLFRDKSAVMGISTSERIVKTPGVCGGRARVAGDRVRVLDIVTWQKHQGLTPDEIVSHVPTITLAEVHAALAYYFDHVEEIQAEMREERALADGARRNHPSQVDAKLREERREAS
jgi:uncharacterized protein (DUF433 family)